MKRLSLLLFGLTFWTSDAAHAQTFAPNEAGVSFGQYYTIVRDVNATKKFWAILGGTAIKIDGLDAMKFPGVLIFLKQGVPTGGSVGTSVNHIGFEVDNIVDTLKEWEAQGIKIDKIGTSPLNGHHTGHFDSPDGVELEITEAGGAPYPPLPAGVTIMSNHIHFSVQEPPKTNRQVMQDWYVKTFSAAPRTLRGELVGGVPGMEFMRYGFPTDSLVPTKGRAVDHIGFEVKNLKEFCDQLAAKGVKLDAPYSATRHKSFRSAELTDPFGTSIELTEGLNKF